MNNFLSDYDTINNNQKLYDIKPMYYSLIYKDRWNFPSELQEMIRNEKDPDWEESLDLMEQIKTIEENYAKGLNKMDEEIEKLITEIPGFIKKQPNCNTYVLKNNKRFIPINFIDDEKTLGLVHEVCPYLKCKCGSLGIRNPACRCSNCFFNLSKSFNVPESKFKDGLDLLDHPSTMLETIDKRERDKERKRVKKLENKNNGNQSQENVNVQHNPLNINLIPVSPTVLNVRSINLNDLIGPLNGNFNVIIRPLTRPNLTESQHTGSEEIHMDNIPNKMDSHGPNN